jgi:hypothetical protein
MEIIFSGGLNEQDDTQVKPEECTEGYNFELSLGNTHFKPRLPFDLKGTATNAASGNGLIQLIKNDNTETTLVQAGDTVYLWDGGSTFTSKGTVTATSKLRDVTWSLGGYSVITDLMKQTVIKKWDGTTFSTLTTGLGGTSLYAKYGLVHLGRIWLFNVKAGTDTPHLMVASAFENPESYNITLRAQDGSFTTGNEAFYMVTPDLLPINGVTVFMGILIVSTENGRIWKLNGSDSTDFAWAPFYSGSSAVGTETMANIGNDVVYMRNGGVIEAMRSTQDYGDVKNDDLTRWIANTTAGLTEAITVYDQEKQKVYFFAGSNKLLVFFKHLAMTELSPWSVYKTDHTSSFNAVCAKYMRAPGTSTWYVFWTDSIGNIYRMEGEGTGDPSSTTINTSRRTKYLYDKEIEELAFVSGRVEYKRIADCDLLMDFEWADDYSISRCTVPLEGPPTGDAATYYGGSAYYGGAFYFNTGFFYANRISTKGFSPVGRGPGVYLTTTVQSTQEFDIIKIRT